jgi:hypothetical protein
MWFFSETHLKPDERFFIPNYHFYHADYFPGRKGGTAVAVRKGIPHSHVDLPALVSIEATDISELLSFTHKSLLAHPFLNSVVFNTSGAKLLNLLHIHEFEISTPQHSLLPYGK